jgi:hypothetical protein
MRSLLRSFSANCPSSAAVRTHFLNAPPSRSFTTTPAQLRFQVPQRQTQVATMAGDMTTKDGRPFDRTQLESLMKVCSSELLRIVVHHVTSYDGTRHGAYTRRFESVRPRYNALSIREASLLERVRSLGSWDHAVSAAESYLQFAETPLLYPFL